jgi:hypothetical protein
MGWAYVDNKEGEEDHCGNSLTEKPRKCPIPSLHAWCQGMFCQMSNVYHKVEMRQAFEQMSPVQEGITKVTGILPGT